MRTTHKRKLTGTVVSTSMDKTITVRVDTYKAHALYGKRIKQSKKFLAHDEKSEANLGDIVIISETKPVSKRKHFRLLEIKEKGTTK